jgi:hypothetical protein
MHVPDTPVSGSVHRALEVLVYQNVDPLVINLHMTLSLPVAYAPYIMIYNTQVVHIHNGARMLAMSYNTAQFALNTIIEMHDNITTVSV